MKTCHWSVRRNKHAHKWMCEQMKYTHRDKDQTPVTSGIRIHITTKHNGASEPGHTDTQCVRRMNTHIFIRKIILMQRHSRRDLSKRIRHLSAFMCCQDYWTYCTLSALCWYRTHHDGCHRSSGLYSSYVWSSDKTKPCQLPNVKSKTTEGNWSLISFVLKASSNLKINK